MGTIRLRNLNVHYFILDLFTVHLINKIKFTIVKKYHIFKAENFNFGCGGKNSQLQILHIRYFK